MHTYIYTHACTETNIKNMIERDSDNATKFPLPCGHDRVVCVSKAFVNSTGLSI